jgi:hypothetical protein
MTKFTATAAILSLAVSLSLAADSPAQDTAVPADVTQQIAKLQSGSPKQKVQAARSLGEMGVSCPH